jgi:hypothetical protein
MYFWSCKARRRTIRCALRFHGNRRITAAAISPKEKKKKKKKKRQNETMEAASTHRAETYTDIALRPLHDLSTGFRLRRTPSGD